MDIYWSKRSNTFMQDLLKATEYELQNVLHSEKAEVIAPGVELMKTNSNIEVSIGEEERNLINTNNNIEVSIGEGFNNIMENKKIKQRQMDIKDSSKKYIFSDNYNLYINSNEVESRSLEINEVENQMFSENVADILKAVPHTSKKRKNYVTITEIFTEDTKRSKTEQIEKRIREDENTIDLGEKRESEDNFEDLTLSQSPFFLILDISGISCEREDHVNEFSKDELPRNEKEDKYYDKNNNFDSSFLYNKNGAEETLYDICDRKSRCLTNSFIRDFPEPRESIKDNFIKEDRLNISDKESLKRQFIFDERDLKFYECYICCEEFKFSKILVQHMEYHGIGKYQCAQCEYFSNNVLEFYRHRAAHINAKPFTCNLCSYESVLMAELTEHDLLHYEKAYDCSMCNFYSVLKEEHDEHIKTHDNEIYLDEHRLLNDDSLQFQEHILWQNNNSPDKGISQFLGNIKDNTPDHMSHPRAAFNQSGKLNLKKSISTSEMNRHMKMHTDEKVSNYIECDETHIKQKSNKYKNINNSRDNKSNEENQLLSHNKSSKNELLFKCKECTLVFNSEINFKLHKVNFTKGRFFKCDECDYNSIEKIDIFKHVKTHSNQLPCNVIYINPQKVNFDMDNSHQEFDSGYKCSICEYATYEKTELYLHLLIHKSEKPHKCYRCNITFPQIGDLKGHIKTHTCEKRFKCTQCKFTTSRSHDLQEHWTLQHNAMMYSCSKCEYDCQNIGDLKKHLFTCFKEINFSCHHCNYESSKKADLNRHLKLCKNLFKCDLCDYGCTKNYELKSHVYQKHPGNLAIKVRKNLKMSLKTIMKNLNPKKRL